MSIASNLQKVKSQLPKNVTLVAVSKTKPVADILEAYNAGQRIFGENKIQEMVDKQAQLPSDIQWHMIGHLQRNKVKYMASFVSMIHGVDSGKTLLEINKQANKHNRIIDCLLQVKIAEEETKFGLSEDEVCHILNDPKIQSMENCRIVGLMGMATFTDDTLQIEREFEHLYQFYSSLQPKHPYFKTLSMGMSGDYKIAINLGSTMVRLGSLIFGAR
ncbi:YggS family pyridoxal phosphate-dependent enzyme [Flavobacteriaceae bacterium F08102]|nr:YggS family pyridoxal phosphate-dependent enzyme [Flavobacteriaceae bacterium F08102]